MYYAQLWGYFGLVECPSGVSIGELSEEGGRSMAAMTDDAQTGLVPPRDFVERVREIGVEFEPGDLERLGRFLHLMLETNKVTNLTAITDPDQAWTKHILDALTLVGPLMSLAMAEETIRVRAEAAGPGSPPTPTTPPIAILSVIDVGSGGGVPAIPLAIVMPDVRFTMVEATGRKVEFLTRAIQELGLKNARVIQGRAEDIGQDHKVHREKYDAAMARALGHLAIVVELCGPLVRPHGIVIAVKGAKAPQEVEESAKAFGLIGLRHVETLETPTGKLVLMEKTTRTPKVYPRRDGEPARVPLGVARK
jgi:16S rRNA (guanine527-N7)-methyltransferase